MWYFVRIERSDMMYCRVGDYTGMLDVKRNLDLNRDVASDSIVEVTRPGRWIDIITADGMVLMPEGGSGCSCNFAIHASMGFLPHRILHLATAFKTMAQQTDSLVTADIPPGKSPAGSKCTSRTAVGESDRPSQMQLANCRVCDTLSQTALPKLPIVRLRSRACTPPHDSDLRICVRQRRPTHRNRSGQVKTVGPSNRPDLMTCVHRQGNSTLSCQRTLPAGTVIHNI